MHRKKYSQCKAVCKGASCDAQLYGFPVFEYPVTAVMYKDESMVVCFFSFCRNDDVKL